MNGSDAATAGEPTEGVSRSPLEEKAEFHTAFSALDADVRRACDGEADWQAKIAEGIRAALGFVTSRPGATATLTVEDGTFRVGADGIRHPELIERYSKLLGEVAPDGQRLPASTNEALVNTIVSVVAIHLKCQTMERLRDATPDLIHLTLLPYTGFADARRYADGVDGTATSPS